LSEIGFLISGAARASGQRRSYRALIEKSLHRSERAHDEGMSAVTLEFETSTGPLSVERKWYFDKDGTFIDDDEELLVRSGSDRHPLSVPDGMGAMEWYQAEIERRILPVELAPFFLFDGEQVERWSERKLSDQVHFALTRLLGLGELGALAGDLRDYARDRERGISDVDEGVADGLQADIDLHRDALERDVELQSKLDTELGRLRSERNTILSALADLGSVSHADLQGLLEGQHRLMAEYRHAQRDLMAAICDDGPLLFAGPKLLNRTSAAIRAEVERQSVALQPDEIESLWRRLVSLEPPLGIADADDLRSRLYRACLAAAEEPSNGAHCHLDRKARRMVIDRLDAAIARGHDRMRDANTALGAIAEQLASAADAVSRQEGNHSRAADMQSELGRIAAAIESTQQEIRPVQARISEHEATLAALGEKVTRLRAAVSGAEPRLRASAQARQLSAAIDRHIQQIAGPEHQRFADAVSASFRTLAHKDQIQRIDIFASGEVRLIDRNDRDLTDYRLSAGESQLFAMALIGAVGTLLGDRLPLVVDTPLGRLDTQHRQSVLDMFARRTAQTILLTQPEELTIDHLDRIRPHVAAIVNLQHAADATTGVGISTVTADPGVLQ
jgi:DNA sulfur modification protein DndD